MAAYEFLFTDIEHSTEKWERYKEAMGRALVRHDGIVKVEIVRNGGTLVKHTGDGIFAKFENRSALRCALGMQVKILRAAWSEVGGLRIRVAVHAGAAERRGDDYFGTTVNTAARVMSLAVGGQILLTPTALEACDLPTGATTADHGTHALKGLTEAQPVIELAHPDLSVRPADDEEFDAELLNPKDLVAVQRLLNGHVEARSFVEGIVAFRKLAGMDQTNAQVMLGLGILYDRGGYGNEAIGAYRRVIQLNPAEEPVYRMLSSRMVLGRYYTEAIKVSAEGLERFPRTPRLHFNAGYAHAMRQNLPAAVAEFTAEVEVNPVNQDAVYNLGLIQSKSAHPLLFRP